MDALAKIKQVSKADLQSWLLSDHRDFNVLNVSFKQIASTQRTSVIISKPSAKNFYLKDKAKKAEPKPQAYFTSQLPKRRPKLVESRSTGRKTISQYLAKYLSKSFHLRNLYQQHGLNNKNKTYRFFKNLYAYEEHKATVANGSKRDFLTGKHLAPNQHLFRKPDNTYYYHTKETLVGHCAKPLLVKKSYRLGYHGLNALPLLKLAQEAKQPASLTFRKKTSSKIVPIDFQEYLITSLLLLAKKAEFLNLPLEQLQVPQTSNKCDQLAHTHFQKMPVLRFNFAKENAQLAKAFVHNLDNQAETFDIEEKQGFADSRFTDPIASRNAYLTR
ncbi:1603_t:CDS:2 [Entrophospora sp. SA101]|nr:1603_t:CDS:2 [Entrophospora sp. SA101]